MYRAVAYLQVDSDPRNAVAWRSGSFERVVAAIEVLQRLLDSELFSGGEIEYNVPGIGWCLDTAEEASEREREPDFSIMPQDVDSRAFLITQEFDGEYHPLYTTIADEEQVIRATADYLRGSSCDMPIHIRRVADANGYSAYVAEVRAVHRSRSVRVEHWHCDGTEEEYFLDEIEAETDL